MRIGHRDTDASIALVAEIGNNHEGSIALAEEMIEAAFTTGADAVKLQTFVPELYVSSVQVDRLEMLRRFALPDEDLQRLLSDYRSRGLTLFSTPFDLTSLHSLSTAPLLKISSGDLTFTQLLEAAARAKKDIIISTGASTLFEVEEAVAVITRTWDEVGYQGGLAALHCVSAYPAPPEAVNLRAIGALRDALPDVVIGYSDHALGIEVALAAAAAGARIIEKHFTLNKNFSDFRDHQLSADPGEFSQLRARLDVLDTMLGSGIKEPQDVETEMRTAIRRSITTTRELPAGHRLGESDLCIVRPGGGLIPSRLSEVVGQSLISDTSAGYSLVDGDIA
jgi:N,N'-diacetyllegionaminate synthase